ncbi:hypothetical protein [Foetidibacter luteolus]|uniref:hypothetical protein n=1 Tax=Foetidibacter luteolus TaxID=2608880 RepID=UPI00129A1584|nr:hypothetical protein [Foetidibacter luteolus]
MQNLLNYICASLLLGLILLKTMAMPIACLQYNINQEYIAENLCENKSRPEMHCNGQCQLKKQLDHANDSNESTAEKGIAKSVSAEYFEPVVSHSFAIETRILNFNLPSNIHSQLLAGHKENIFHPPLCC